MQNRAYLDTPPSVKELYHKKVGPTRCVWSWMNPHNRQHPLSAPVSLRLRDDDGQQ
jgi:hypothetical protein